MKHIWRQENNKEGNAAVFRCESVYGKVTIAF